MRTDQMPMTSELRETVSHGSFPFPIQYYVDELSLFHNRCVPLHWHPEPEFFLVSGGQVEIQAGVQHLQLSPGECIFINENVLHSYRQTDQSDCCCPNIVFSGSLIAPAGSIIYQKYLKPLFHNTSLPCIRLSPEIGWQSEIISHLLHCFALLSRYGESGAYEQTSVSAPGLPEVSSDCLEMEVQNDLNRVFQILCCHHSLFPETPIDKNEQQSQIRLQKMLSFIHKNYKNPLSLHQIADSASISRSEAGRCFQTYMNCAPVEYLLQYRLEQAQKLLRETSITIKEIGYECGFSSTSYFVKTFHSKIGLTPSAYRAGHMSG